MGDVSTHWGSTISMVSRILEQQQAIPAVIVDEQKYWHKMPNDIEFTTLEAVHDILKLLSTLTDTLAGKKHVTASEIIPVLKHT